MDATPPTDCPRDTTIADFVGGRLAPPDAASIRQHVDACAECRELLAALEAGADGPAETGDAIACELLRNRAAVPSDVSGAMVDRKYRLLRLLGKGGMGEVYEAEHTPTGRRVALKLIRARLLAAGDDARRRFQREGRAAAAIDSPHLVRVLDAGDDEESGDLYLVMELLRGEDLRHLVERLGRLSPDTALRVAAQALEGLAEVHALGIVHRDVKAANLYLARRDGGGLVLKILDFGIAKTLSKDAGSGETTDITHTGAVLGSPRYMSPEQARGFGSVSARSDLWSLGVVLYEMLTGTVPHADVDGMYGLAIAICTRPARPVRELAPWVSPELAAIVEKALQIDPADRFSSAAEMLEEIVALLPEGTSLEEASLVPPRGELAAAATSRAAPRLSLPPPPASGPTPASARPLVRPLLALSALVVGGALAYGVVGSRAPAAAADHGAVAPLPPQGPPPPVAALLAPPSLPREERTVRLSVEPADAAAEVDGRPTPVDDGGIALTGTLGSAHQVRLTSGAGEISTEVAITETGAVPSKVRIAARVTSARPKAQASAHDEGQAPAGASSSAPASKHEPPARIFE